MQRGGDDRVGQVIQWLEDDHARQGSLSLDDVFRAVERSGLSPLESLEVQEAVGPLLGEDATAPGLPSPDDAAIAHNASTLLTAAEEVALKRRVAAGEESRLLLNGGAPDSALL